MTLTVRWATIRRSRWTLYALAVTLLAVTIPFWEILTGRATAMYGDVNDHYVPGYVAVWRMIREGVLPFWVPNVFAGQSAVGSGQYAVFYPLNALFGIFEPVMAYKWWTLVHLWLGATGAFFWSLRRWGSRTGATVTGVAYGLNGVVVLHLVHSAFLAAAAWLPLMFLGIDLVFERWSSARASAVAVPLALIAFTGQPQLLWMAAIGGAGYIAARAAGRRSAWRGAVRCVAAMVCGIGLAAIQLYPQFLFSQTSVRPSLPPEVAFEGSILLPQLLMLAFPYVFGGASLGPASPWLGSGIFHEVGSYVGMTVIVLAAVGTVRLWRDRGVRALVVMIVLALLVSLGDSTPLGGLLYAVVPGARLFRHWGRFLWLVHLGLAVLAGAGVRELVRRPREAVVPMVSGVAIAGALAVLLPNLGSFGAVLARGSAGVISRAVPILLLVGLLIGLAVALRKPRVGAGVIVLFCAVDVIWFASAAPWRALGVSPTEAEAFYDESSAPSFGSPHDSEGGIDRWMSSWYGFRSVSLAKDVHGLNGYDPLLQADWAQTAGGWAWDGYPTRSDLWQSGWASDVLRVTTLILQEDIAPGRDQLVAEGVVSGLDFVRWVQSPRLPEAYLVGAVEVASLDEIRARLADPSAAFTELAYVDATVEGIDRLGLPGVAGVVLRADVLGSGRVEVEAESDALLVLSHSWQPGWRATVDQVEVPVVRTNGLVLGVPVPPGRHVVIMRFRPPGLHLGFLITVLALVSLFLRTLLDLGRRASARLGLPIPTRSSQEATATGEAVWWRSPLAITGAMLIVVGLIAIVLVLLRL